jgi:hypothetical protein
MCLSCNSLVHSINETAILTVQHIDTTNKTMKTNQKQKEFHTLDIHKFLCAASTIFGQNKYLSLF